MGQDATRQILAEILLNERSNRETILTHVAAAGELGFQMALHHLINCAALRMAEQINRSAWNAFRHSLATGLRSHNPIWE